MAKPRTNHRVRLSVESLEGRDLPSAVPLGVEEFATPLVGMPAGWSQWSNRLDSSFNSGVERGLGGPGGLAINGTSDTDSRAWLSGVNQTDVSASVAVYVDSLVPATLFVRGQQLDTASPTYYGVTVTRGLEVQLVRVVDGQTTILGRATTKEWFSNQWAKVTLIAQGNTLQVLVFRTDTAQYLSEDGTWHGSPTTLLSRTDSAISGEGGVGLARPSRVAGGAIFDRFEVGPPPTRPNGTSVHDQDFDPTGSGLLPAGWRQWHNQESDSFQISREQSALVGSNVLTSTAASTGEARAWLDANLPADLQVAASVYLNSLIPAELIARGKNLGTASPTYYAASVARGMQVQIVKVIDGQREVLASTGTQGWQSDLWTHVTFDLQDDRLRVQVYRPDQAKYLTPNGTWVASATWALETTDSSLRGGGTVGVGRGHDYAGALVFDNFSITTPQAGKVASPPPARDYSFDEDERKGIPVGWTTWSTSAKGGFQVSGPSSLNPTNSLISTGDRKSVV